MIVMLKPDADADAVRRELTARGLWITSIHRGPDSQARYLEIAEYSARVDAEDIASVAGVAHVAEPASAHPCVDKQRQAVDVGGIRVGPGAKPVVMSGPCSVETEEQIVSIARRLAPMGVTFLRGGAFKPRTSPYAFQGHGDRALAWMRRAADENGMRVVTEALSEADVEAVSAHADLVQIGSRNMQNYALLKAAGRGRKPVLLKRAMSATLEEWLLAGEYLLTAGAPGVIFCERGIRGFDPSTRNLLDLGAVALLANVLRQPVIVDPSHGTGRRDLIAPLARAALAAGAAGVMIETHEDPGRALSDGPQALRPEQLGEILATLPGFAASGGLR